MSEHDPHGLPDDQEPPLEPDELVTPENDPGAELSHPDDELDAEDYVGPPVDDEPSTT